MKAFIFLSLLLTSCATTSSLTFSPTPVSGEALLLVHGLSCPLCASNLYDELNTVPGVVKTWGNLDTGLVHVEMGPEQTVTEADLNQAVADAGFTLKTITSR